MTATLMGKKKGMMQVFDDKGNVIVCTVIHVEPNVITQIKTVESDGYNAIQVGCEKVVAKDPRRQEARTKKPQRGHFKKAGVEARRYLTEFRVGDIEGYTVGDEFSVTNFAKTKYVDVVGKTKGKGFQGVMKLHGFAGGPASHGSKFHRTAGSTGMCSDPGRSWKGSPRASHMGDNRQTTEALQVVRIIEEDNVILVKGPVPGAREGLVYIRPSVKKTAAAAA